ncbi:MAG: adenylate/guanylate cyclase domain-containing protein [Thaumarchaeota archaeon]|nr:MAG: adenylate/guanylate cyclase domain-containing protein [Nitrososphaerota archaeon]TLX95276.1 MAG: adenylate/guanylate cyclase domain-containing protein [Nitrososphaerota archaeon]
MSEEPEKKGEEPMSTSSIVDMMLSGGKTGGTLDTESLVKDTQKRVWGSLKKGYEYEYDYSIDESDKFLREHVAQKMHMIVIFVDLVGSTDMALSLPPEKLGIIVSSFSQEMRFVIRHHGGYVLKYVGDAIIGYFLAEENPLMVSDSAVNCAKTMIDVIERGINPVLSQYEYPELRVKIGMDFGENVIVRYGSDQIRSHVDILGPAVSIAAKITDVARPNQILIGEDVYEKLHPALKELFKKVEWHGSQWSYHDRETGKLYGVYAMHP